MLPGELVDDVRRPEDPAIIGLLIDKVLGPDVVGILWP